MSSAWDHQHFFLKTGLSDTTACDPSNFSHQSRHFSYSPFHIWNDISCIACTSYVHQRAFWVYNGQCPGWSSTGGQNQPTQQVTPFLTVALKKNWQADIWDKEKKIRTVVTSFWWSWYQTRQFVSKQAWELFIINSSQNQLIVQDCNCKTSLHYS